MANTYELIASSSVGAGGAANITFSNIPQTYTDLKIVVSARSNYDGSGGGSNLRDAVAFYFNGNNTSSSWSQIFTYGIPGLVIGSGSSTAGNYSGGGYSNGTGNTASAFGSNEIYISNYTGSLAKPVQADGVSESNSTSTGLAFQGNITNNTSAVTSVTLVPGAVIGFSWVQYTTAYIYGIKKS